MRICGVSLNSKEAALVVIDYNVNGDLSVVDTGVPRISLTDHADAQALRDFAQTIGSFIRDNSINIVAVRRCTYKGRYLSSAAAIKMEALFQLTDDANIELISPQTIKADFKRANCSHPENLKKYQHEAFEVALTRAHAES